MLLALRSLWEPSVTPTPTLPNAPGRVYRGTYPYWRPRRKPGHSPYDDEEEELEELMAMIGIDL